MTTDTESVNGSEPSVKIELLLRDLERGLANTPLSDAFRKLRADPTAAVFVASTSERISIAALKSANAEGGFRAAKADLRKLVFNVSPPKDFETRYGESIVNPVLWVHNASRALRSRRFYESFLTWGSCAVLIAGREGVHEERVACELSKLFSLVIAIDCPAVAFPNMAEVSPPCSLLRLQSPSEQPRGKFLCGLLAQLMHSPHVRLLRHEEQMNHFLGCVTERLRSELIFIDLHLASVTRKLDDHPAVRIGGRVEWIEQIKRRLDRQSREIIEQIDDRRDQVLQPLSPLMVKFRQRIRGLDSDSLITDKVPGGFVCFVSPEFVNVITDLVYSDLKLSVEADVDYLNSRLTQLVLSANARMQYLSGQDLRLTLDLLSFRELWCRVENLVAFVGESTTFSVKRRGFFDLLTAGRQKVFVIIMMASLLGRAGMASVQVGQSTVVNTLFIAFLLAVFVSGSISGWRIWKSDQEELKRKEIEQMRKRLHDDAMQVSRNVLEKAGKMIRESLKRQEEQWKESELEFIEGAFRRKCQIESESLQRQLNVHLSNLRVRHQEAGAALSQLEELQAASKARLVQIRKLIVERCTVRSVPHVEASGHSVSKERRMLKDVLDRDEGQAVYPLQPSKGVGPVEDGPATLASRRESRRNKRKNEAT